MCHIAPRANWPAANSSASGSSIASRGDAVTGELLASLLEEAQHRHVQIVVARHEPRMDALEVAKRLAGSGVSGMLLPPPIGDRFEVLDFLTTARLPTVSVACGNSLHSSSSVTIDDRRAAFAMTGHLLALGHSRIGFVMGDPTRECSMLRLLGYRAALEKAGLPFRKELMVQGFGTFHSGLRAGEALLGLAHPPTAVFASNDEMAAAVIAVAHRQGFALPLELTVCGFGNTPVASAVWPELTTIGQPLDEMARAALSALLLELVPAQKRPPSPQTKILDFALVRRQSDGKPHPLATQAKHSLAG